jgi:hypothetical protein
LPICHSLHTSVWFPSLINDERVVGPPNRPVAASRVYLTVGHNCKLSLTDGNALTQSNWALDALTSKKALFMCPVRAAYPPTAPSLLGSRVFGEQLTTCCEKVPVFVFLLSGIHTDPARLTQLKVTQFDDYGILKKINF